MTRPAILLLLVSLLLAACRQSEDDRFPPYDCTPDFEAFVKSKPDFFRFGTPADIPGDLHWENGQDLPDLGSPDAVKGGTYRYLVESFPATFRFIGPDANDSFRSEHWDDIYTPTVARHMNVEGWHAGIASEWAVSPDRRRVYFRIDPEATYSDGVPVLVDDYFFTFYVMLSPHIQDPWYNDYYAKEYSSITKYDDRTFCLELPNPRPDPLWYTGDFQPLPRHFFREFGPDFPARYQWRKSPTTGAYEIYPDRVIKGRSVTMTRVKDWWARDRKFFRNRFNPDFIEYRVIGSLDKAFEMFRQGQLDFFPMTLPQYWYDKSEIPEVYNGWIEKAVFYNDYPRITRGIYINSSKPLLDNQDIRLGINYSLNWRKVLEIDFRGDQNRMRSTFEGFGKFTNPALRPRDYDPAKAAEHFAKAGFVNRGPDGILVDGSGRRLSFTLTLANLGNYPQICLRLKEDAVSCGLELQLEALDATQVFQKGDRKNHEMILVGWAASLPYPRFWEYYHSDNAWETAPDGTRKPKAQTNNFTMTADPEMDVLIDRQRAAQTDEEMQKLSWELEEIVQDKGAAIPAWEAPWYRYGHWRWLRFPDDGNVRLSQLPWQSYVFWLDEEVREETREAMRTARSFGEVTRIYDQYRQK